MVSAMNSKLPTHDALSPIIHDIHCLLLGGRNWKASCVPRNLNREADSFASFAYITRRDSVWVEDYPSCIEYIVQDEKLCTPKIHE